MRVVAAVIRDKDRFLACRRSGDHALAGKWEFPGGKVEPGETDQVALVREISEELGVAIFVEDFIVESTIPTELGAIEMFTYIARLCGERPTQSTDHDQMKWLSISELSNYDWAELDIPVIDKLLELFNT